MISVPILVELPAYRRRADWGSMILVIARSPQP